MRDLNNFINWMFSLVEVFYRRTFRKVQGILYYRKCEKVISQFQTLGRDDIDRDNVPVILFEDYPTVADLNRYLRENFGMKYPTYIESINNDCTIVLKMVAIGEEFLEHKPGILNFNNGYGKIYTYQEYVMRKAYN